MDDFKGQGLADTAWAFSSAGTVRGGKKLQSKSFKIQTEIWIQNLNLNLS